MHTTRKWQWWIAAGVLAGALLVGCGSPAPQTPVAASTVAPTVPAATQAAEDPTEVPPTDVVAAPEPTVAPTEAAPTPTLAALDPEALLQERCSSCHDLGRVTSAAKSAEDWRKTVTRMVAKGASLSDAEVDALVEYLAQKYGK